MRSIGAHGGNQTRNLPDTNGVRYRCATWAENCLHLVGIEPTPPSSSDIAFFRPGDQPEQDEGDLPSCDSPTFEAVRGDQPPRAPESAACLTERLNHLATGA